MTLEIEERKKRLADTITSEVFKEMDSRFHSRQEINREIKKRLRDRYQKEAFNSMIEIVDLEANFIRAPLQMVLDQIQKQVTTYIKHYTEKAVKQ